MARSVVAKFESYPIAKKAISELTHAGIQREMIHLAVQSEKSVHGKQKAESIQVDGLADPYSAGARIGAGVFSAVGVTAGLIAAFSGVNLPFDLQPAVLQAVTITASGLAGAFVGMLAGSLLSGLGGAPISDEEVRQYSRAVSPDGVTVSVFANRDEIDQAIGILAQYNPLDLREVKAVQPPAAQHSTKSPIDSPALRAFIQTHKNNRDF